MDPTSRLPFSDAADRVLDELLPGDFDWRTMVRTYPGPAIAVAAVVGFGLGRSHGGALVAALTALAGDRIARHLRSAGG